MLFKGKQEIPFNYSAYGWTRNNGKTFHGGVDIKGREDNTIYFPDFKGKAISGTIVASTIITNKSNRTWEWGNYVCVKLDANQTPDIVNYLYFCHNSQNIVKFGDKVKTGMPIAIMGNTGNAALASPPIEHVHFEVRQSQSGQGLDPSAYTGIPNKMGVYGTSIAPAPSKKGLYGHYVEVSKGDLKAFESLAKEKQVKSTVTEL